MHRSVVVSVVRWSRQGLCWTLALALSLMCVVLGAGATAHTAPMAGMPGMAESSMVVATATPATAVAHAATPSAWEAAPSAGSSCEGICLTEMGAACAAALAVITLLGLVLTSRRNTFTGLLARARSRALPRRRQRPWSLLSPFSLCVLRV